MSWMGAYRTDVGVVLKGCGLLRSAIWLFCIGGGAVRNLAWAMSAGSLFWIWYRGDELCFGVSTEKRR